MIWILFALLIAAQILIFRTSIGLRIRSVGEHPRAADTVGISVYKTRYGAVVLSGVIASLGGAYLAVGYTHSFTENMTAGRGFIGLAALIFGNWRPGGAFAAALLFGFFLGLSTRIQQYGYEPQVLAAGAPVRCRPRGGCWSNRPVDPACSGWTALRQAVANRGRTPAQGGRSCAGSWRCSPCRRASCSRASCSRSRFGWRRSRSRSRRCSAWFALILARRARETIQLTLGRAGGAGAARVGRLLGLIGILLAITAGLAVGFWGLLALFAG